MGNNINNDSFYMHIKIMGTKMQKFYDNFKKSTFLRNIIKYWDIDKLEILNEENLCQYFDYLEKIKINDDNKTINLREVLILKINNIFEPEVNILLGKINNLSQTYYMPLVLLLTVNNSNQKLKIDTEEYDNIDPRLFFVAEYTEEPEILKKKIYPLFLRFCSILNELGDTFCVGKGNKEENFDLIEKNFPFNLNIACMGRFGQGKSTGVNALLKEYKAKESNKGSSQTKNLTFYQVKNYPIRVLDIPGFEDENSVEESLRKLKLCGEKINRIKDKIHIILYFLNYLEEKAFMKLEYPLIEEITKHKTSKLIYVITHSKSNINEKLKKKIFERINSGIKGITKIPEQIEKFRADNNNVVFVNFHKNIYIQEEPFGKKELFKKIYDVFIQSDEYKNSLLKLTKEKIEENALKLRAEAKEKLLINKIGGGAVGIIPLLDMAAQHFFIKKNAVKKVGEIFGIDVKFIDEENAKNEEKEKKKKEKEHNLDYTQEIDGKKELEESVQYIVGNTAKGIGETIAHTSGGFTLAASSASATNAVNLTIKATDLGVKAAQLGANAANLTAKATQLATEAAIETKNMNSIVKFWYTLTGTSSALSKAASSTAAQAAIATKNAASASQAATSAASSAAAASSYTSLCRFGGTGFIVFGIVLGVVVGGYSIHKFCEELLDKFVDYYKNNADKLANSYKNAADYFLKNNED